MKVRIAFLVEVEMNIAQFPRYTVCSELAKRIGGLLSSRLNTSTAQVKAVIWQETEELE